MVFSNNLKGINIPLNGELYRIDVDGTAAPVLPTNLTISSIDRSSQTINFDDSNGVFVSPGNSLAVGDPILIGQPSKLPNSNKVRDGYAVISAEYTPVPGEGTEQFYELSSEELYAINVNFENSPLNDAIGKQ